jgi:hypothetical protein
VKPGYLTWLAAFASAAFAYWLLHDQASEREVWLVAVAWLLGFWLASGLNSALHQELDEEWDEEDED